MTGWETLPGDDDFGADLTDQPDGTYADVEPPPEEVEAPNDETPGTVEEEPAIVEFW